MYLSGKSEPAFQHAADHAGDVVVCCGPLYPKGFSDTTGFRELDVDEVAGAMGSQPNGVAGVVTTFIGHDGDGRFLTSLRQEIVVIADRKCVVSGTSV